MCALSWCRDDFTDDLVWDARDVLYDYDVDSDGFTTIELNTYTPETLEAFLARRVFASAKGSTLAPTASGKTGFDAWLARYRGLLEAEKAAVAAL